MEASYRGEDTITDDDIVKVLAAREAAIKRLKKAPFEDMRRYLAQIDLQVEISNRVATIKNRLPVPAQHLELDQGFELCAASGAGSYDNVKNWMTLNL